MSAGSALKTRVAWSIGIACLILIVPLRCYTFMAAVALLTAVGIYKRVGSADRRFIVLIFIASLTVRWVLSMILMDWAYMNDRYGFISGDERLYSLTALDILEQMKRGTFTYHILYFGYNLYTYILALFYGVFGYQLGASKLLNVYISSLIPVSVYWIGARLGLRGDMRRVAVVLAAFYPSFVYWGTHNIKEPLIILSICLAYHLMLKTLDRDLVVADIFSIFFLSLMVVNIQVLYIYVMLVIACCFVVRYCSKVVNIISVICLLAAAAFFIIFKSDAMIRALIYLEMHQWNMSIVDKAGYFLYPMDFKQNLELGRIDLVGFVSAYVRGICYFLFAPFPWRIDSLSKFFAMPQNLLWYAMQAFSVVGIVMTWRRSWNIALASIIFILGAYSLWALTEGNIGAAFRHRDHYAAIVFVFACIGIEGLVRSNKIRTKKI